MGNYGPDIEHWYHYGAVMIWSHKTNAQLIANQNTTSKLEWINYLSQNLQKIDAEEILSIEEILKVGFNQNSDPNLYRSRVGYPVMQVISKNGHKEHLGGKIELEH